MIDERQLPALYMVWPAEAIAQQSYSLSDDYLVRSYQEGDKALVLALFSTEDGWSMSEDQWSDYYDRLLPSGLFLAFHAPSRTMIGTAGAVHNPRAGRYYFPFGGELANLLVHPAHRGHGLGRMLCLHVVQRFLTAGYTSIRLGVQGWRLPAVKTYFTTGFVPFLYQPDLAERWERVCHTIDWPYTPHKWLTTL